MRMLAAALAPALALGQAWPQKPVKLIAPYPPGGQTEIVLRWLGERIAPALGQPLVVENRRRSLPRSFGATRPAGGR